MSKLSVSHLFGSMSPQANRLTAADVAQALRHTFDLTRDRIVADPIHLLDLPTVPTGRRLRFDPGHTPAHGGEGWRSESERSMRENAGDDADSAGPAADSLSTALGIVRAREVLLAAHWIIVVVDARSALSAACLEQMTLLARQRRLLIIWCEFSGGAAAPQASHNARLLEEMLVQSDLGHLGPLSGMACGELISIFQALKARGQASLVRLCVDDRAASAETLAERRPAAEGLGGIPASPETRLAGDHPAPGGAEEGIESAAVQSALLDAAAGDSRVVMVDCRTATADRWLSDRLGQRYVAAGRDAHVWSWCAGLVAGGCRPLLLIAEGQWRSAATSLAALPDGAELRATAVVFADPRRTPPPFSMRGGPLPEATLAAASDLQDFQSLLSYSLGQDGLTVIWAPAAMSQAEPGPTAEQALMGRAVVEMRGADLAILSCGAAMPIARQAARQLVEVGIAPTLLNLRFLQPVDYETISSVIDAAPLAVVLDEPLLGTTAAAAIASVLAARDLATPTVTMAPRQDSVIESEHVGRVVARCRGLARRGEPSRKTDMHRRFDAAESAWLERQTQAGAVEREQIMAKQFSPELAAWIDDYSQVGLRGGYLWKWCLHGVELTTLDCVPAARRAHACDTKVLAGMLNVLFDDVADQQGRADLLSELLRLTHDETPQLSRLSADDRRYGEFTCEVWSEFWRRAKRYPCYDPYAALLQFDLAQLFNTVYYSQLVNSNPYILNVVEHDDYSPQGMGLLSFAMIDLMCSPEFSVTDLGRLREAMWHAQWMARIGNLITTWQREIRDRDYSSGVFARAVANHDLTVEQLLTASPALIERAIDRGRHEAYFLRRWKEHRAQVLRLRHGVKSVDLEVMVRGLERLLQTELGSRGKK